MSGYLGARLIAGARGRVVVTVILLAASLIVHLGIARRFGFVGLGEYTATTLVVFIASVVFLVGVPLATGRLIAQALEAEDEAGARDAAATGLVAMLLLSLLAAAVVWSFWDGLMDAMRVERRVPALAAAGAILAAGTLHYVSNVFQARLQMMVVGLITIVQPVAAVVALLLERAYGGIAPADVAVLGYLAGGTAAAIAFIAAGYRTYLARQQLVALLRASIESFPLLYASIFSAWTDRVLVALVLGPAALGIYQAAFAVVDGSLRLPRSAASFLVSAYARISASRPEELERTIRVHVRIWVVSTAVLASGLIAGADGIATTLFGFGFAVAAAPLAVMAAGLVPGIVALSLATAATGRGAVRVPVYVAASTIPLQFALILALAPRLGVVGAAAAYALSALAGLLGYLWWGRGQELITPQTQLPRTLLHAVAAIGLAAALAALPVPWSIRLAAASVTAAALTVGLLGSEERGVIRRLAQGS